MTHLTSASENATCYEQILRAIGQGLEALKVESFDIAIEGDNYIVQGLSESPKKEETVPTETAPKPTSFKSILHNFRNLFQIQPLETKEEKTPMPFVFLGLRFGQEDVERLQRHGKAQRLNWRGSPDPHRLSHMLRVLGAYVDRRGGRLLKVSVTPQALSICYRARFGDEQTETFTYANIYDLWVHLYKQRSDSLPKGAAASRSA